MARNKQLAIVKASIDGSAQPAYLLSAIWSIPKGS